MGKTATLEAELNTALDEFRQNIEFNYETFDSKYCDKDDMRELAKQTFYTLDQFKKAILLYLEKS